MNSELKWGQIMDEILAMYPKSGGYAIGVLLHNLILVVNGVRRGTFDFNSTFNEILLNLQRIYSRPTTSLQDKHMIREMYLTLIRLPQQHISKDTSVWTHKKLSPEIIRKLVEQKSQDITLGEILEYPCPRNLNERMQSPEQPEITYSIRWFPDRSNTRKFYELYTCVCPLPAKENWNKMVNQKCTAIDNVLRRISSKGGIQCLKTVT